MQDFVFENVRTSVVNALRRTVLAEVPYVATNRDETKPASHVGGFVVRHNTGRIHNDMLCDRIALVPIHLTKSEVDNFIPGSITVQLAVNNEKSVCMNVTSKDLQVLLFGKPHPNARACFPADKVTGDWPLVTRLYPGEKIDVTATLEKGCAKRHAAFAVASCVGMMPSLDLDKANEERAKIESNKSLDESERLRALNHHDHIGRLRTVLLNKDGEPQGYKLAFQSECGLKESEILQIAMEVLTKKFSGKALTYESRVDGSSILYTIQGHGHTFGNMLQDICMHDRQALGIRSIGYFETHPLEDRIVVRVDMPGGASEAESADPDDLMAKMRVHCTKYMEGVIQRVKL